jgi:spermidine/putrescine transport system ATP-binding protein
VMNEGRLEQIGPPEEIYHEPATEFVADFIGDTNLFEGTVVDRDGESVVEVGGPDGFTVPADGHRGDVTVSIRPEDFDFADGEGDFAGEVVERYFQGDQTNYVLDADSNLEEVQVVVQGREGGVERGDHVPVRVVPGTPTVF